MDFEVTFLISYTIEDVEDKWQAITDAEAIFACDTHLDYDIDVNPIYREENKKCTLPEKN